MKKLLITLAIALTANLQLWADVVPVSEAQTIASQFLQKNSARRARVVGKTLSPSAELKLSAVGDASSYYIFNVGTDDGFVVVSGDDATEEILGYSYSGHIHPDSMPCNMRMLFDSYTDQIRFLREHGITKEQNLGARKAARKSAPAFHVDESRLARFGQGDPYNADCPKYTKWDFQGIIPWSNVPCATGCAATAMAQLMYAFQWPNAISHSISSYITETREFEVEGFPKGTSINWSNIEKRYHDGRPITKEQEKEIAKLMKIAGVSVRMDYNEDSEASLLSVAYALKQTFGYSLKTSFVRSYSDQAFYDFTWIEMLRQELQKGYPIIYRGENRSGGKHFFMLEGYDENDYFDINFGWEGKGSDGENLCHLLLYIKDGLENKLIDYYKQQDAIISVEPNIAGSSDNVPLTLYVFNLKSSDDGVYKRSDSSRDFENISISCESQNHMPCDNSLYDVGVKLLKDGVQKGDVVKAGTFDMPFRSKSYNLTLNFSLGKGETNGLYKLNFLSKESGTTEWISNEIVDIFYMSAWICGDVMSIQSDAKDVQKLSAIRLHANEQFKLGQRSLLNYRVTNPYGDYDGAIIVAVWNEEKGYKALKIVEAHLGPNEKTTISAIWTPEMSGEWEIRILDKCWNEIYSKAYQVADSDEPTNNLAATTVTIENGSIEEQSFTGSILRGTMTITNQDNCAFADTVSLVLSTGLNEQRQQGYRLSIAPGESIDVPFEFRGLKVGREYTLRALMGEDMLQFYESPALESHFAVPDIPDDESADVANHDLTHYEYWFDDDYSSRQRVSIGGTRTNIVEAVSTEALSHGLHYFNVRLQQDDGEYSPVSSTQFMKSGVSNQAAKSIEYWFDDDFGNKLTADLSGSPLEVDDAVGTDQLGNGLHRLNARVKYTDRVNAVYSPVSTTPFFKYKGEAATKVVYWFDEDYAHRAVTPLPSKGSNGLTSINFDLSDMTRFPLGLHRMHLCFATSENKVISSVYKFLLLKMVSGSVNQIEYWVDDDFKDGRKTVDGTFEAKDGEYVFVDPFDLSGVPFGSHTVNYRAVVDGGTIYSPVSSAHVMKIGRGKADKIEYWVDGDTTTVKTVTGTLDTADGAYVFVDPFDLSGVTNGLHRVFYRVAAENGEPGSAIGMMPVIVKSMYGPGPALMTQYRIVADDDTELASGTLNLKQEAELNLTLDASTLGEGEHKLQATFWNSFGGSTATDWTPFWVRGPLTGDVNRDGQVGIGDIVAVTNFMAGSAGDVTLMQADVNGDGDVGIGDIVAITNIMAGADN